MCRYNILANIQNQLVELTTTHLCSSQRYSQLVLSIRLLCSLMVRGLTCQMLSDSRRLGHWAILEAVAEQFSVVFILSKRVFMLY